LPGNLFHTISYIGYWHLNMDSLHRQNLA